MPLPLYAALAGGAGLAQAVIGALPTKQSRYNAQQIKGLQAKDASGNWLDPNMGRQIDRQALVGKQAQGAMANQYAAQAASMGATSAAEQSRLRKEVGQQGAAIDQRAMDTRLAAETQARDSGRQELEGRLASKAARTGANIDNIFGAIAGGAGLAGQQQGLKAAEADVAAAGQAQAAPAPVSAARTAQPAVAVTPPTALTAADAAVSKLLQSGALTQEDLEAMIADGTIDPAALGGTRPGVF